MKTATEFFVDIESVHPSPDNPRRHVGDLSELTASIRSLGVLQPLVVVAEDDGYTVVAGARRLEAARAAGLKEVPIVEREFDELQRQEAMLVENLQRSDLAPLEETFAYHRLIELGRTQRDLAKRIGRSEAHISKRLSLGKLPEPARAALDAGEIGVREAENLTRLLGLPDGEEAIVDLVKDRSWRGIEAEVDRLVLNEERRVAAVAAVEKLRAAGLRVLDPKTDVAGYIELEYLDDELDDLDIGAHQSEPCHAVIIGYGNNVIGVCTAPERHGGTPLGAEDDEGKPLIPSSVHDRRSQELKAAEEIRLAVCQDACRRMPSKAATEVILWQLIENTGDVSDYHLVCRLLELPAPTVKADEGTETVEPDDWDDAWEEAVARYAETSPTALARAALGVALANAEQELGWRKAANRRHFAFLATLGYEPTPAEVEHFDLADDTPAEDGGE